MATYSGMSLRGELRESISLDEDDMSDVEDEVFIRDGKNGYKLAEEINMKRPLMAPRRKVGRSDANKSLKNKTSCKALCKPCCYVCAALSIFIGLIVIVVVIVSIYPLPLDKLREWASRKPPKDEPAFKLLPCNDLKVFDIWSASFPKISTNSSVRTLDVNGDAVDDILFGFGTGDNYNVLPPSDFCPIFMGVPPPCEGGIVALNGVNGDIIWRVWTNDSVYSLQCVADINGDSVNDCLALGVEGTILVINAVNGSTIWRLESGGKELYVANFIPDQNNDSVSDILASHSSFNKGNNDGHIILLSGKTGKELGKLETPNGVKTFYMPQLLMSAGDGNGTVLYGTGTPTTPGNLSVFPLEDIVAGKWSNHTKTIYQDKFKGMLNPAVLVDITGDGNPDIISSMFNSTLVAIDGKTFTQIWNFTVPGSKAETTLVPTPAYFTFDNITDFLINYHTVDEILNNTYTQTFIIDGKTGESIYAPIIGSSTAQTDDLTLGMESHGYDSYLFWTSDCISSDIRGIKSGNLDGDCKNNLNSSRVLKLYALSQFHQPPGSVLFNSAESGQNPFNDTPSPFMELREYFKTYPTDQLPGQREVDEDYKTGNRPIRLRKYGFTNLESKEDVNRIDNTENEIQVGPDLQDYQWSQNPPEPRINDLDKLESYYNDYPNPVEDEMPIAPNQNVFANKKVKTAGNRDPRNKVFEQNSTSTIKKKNLAEKNGGIYDLRNVHLAKNRLLHDLGYRPTEILKDTFVRNEERRLRKSRFEQRDVDTHYDKVKEKEDIRKTIDEEIKKVKNTSFNLWDLESENEVAKQTDESFKAKRGADRTRKGFGKVVSVGAVLDSLNKTSDNESDSIDIVFIIYWHPPQVEEIAMLKKDIRDCVAAKMLDTNKVGTSTSQNHPEKQEKDQIKHCVEEQENLKNVFGYFDKLHRLQSGQMTVYRLRIECECMFSKEAGQCAKFLPKKQQRWSSYLGNFGNGVSNARP